MIVIICAEQEEFNEIVKLMSCTEEGTLEHIKIVTGKIENEECTVALCAVGKVHAAICCQSLIMKFRPKLILNVGVAGAIDERLNIGDAVVASGLIQHDYDISAFSHRKKGEINGLDCVEIKPTKWVREKLLNCLAQTHEIKSYEGIILTGDQFINSKEKLRNLKEEFGGIACDMEAASIAQTCKLAKTDFAVLRTISDSANESSHVDFYSFLKSSSRTAAASAGCDVIVTRNASHFASSSVPAIAPDEFNAMR